MALPRPSRPLPAAIGPFRLSAPLGQGGFAPVWRAEEIHGGKKLRDVAIKLFFLPEGIPAASPEASLWLDAVIDEARALCRVEHPNVVRFYTLQRDDAHGVAGLVMEHVGGENLGVRLRRRGPLPEPVVLDVGISIAWALAAVHHAGLVHRDVKPENVIEAAAGYRLIDFGIAADDATRPAPRRVGTPGYIPPEVRVGRARPSPAGDLYALGVTLSMLATGRLPAARTTAPCAPPERAAASLFELIALLLESDPHARPQHADWVARELERLRRGAEPPRAPPSEPERRRAESPRLVRAPGIPSAAAETPVELDGCPPLVGRDDALALLERAALEAREGSLRIVLLTGPLGVGRSRLLDAAVERSGVPPARTLRAHGSPERRGWLRPLRAALRAHRDGGDGALRLLDAAIDRALAPAMVPAPGQGDEALEAVEDALLVSAAEEPLVLAVDDVQWADERTLELLQLLVERATRGARAKLLVLAAARDEPNASAPLRSLLGAIRGRTCPGARHVVLGPLTAPQAAALAQGVCPLDPDLERAVVRGSGGVPFFLVHPLVAWRETGAIVWHAGVFRAADEHVLTADPPGVAALVEARLASYFVPDSPRWRAALRVLSAVALRGDGLPVAMLARVCGADDSLDDVLGVLVDAAILVVEREPQEARFAQEMVRLSVLGLVRSRPWFCRLHRALLDAVAEGPEASSDAAFLALGYEKLGCRGEARTWLGRAMDGALRAGLFAEATALGDRLAPLAVDAEARADVAIAVVRALVQGRQFEAAKERLDRREAGADAASAHDLRWRILRLEVARGRSEAAGDPALLAAADALGDPATACEARMALAGVARGEHAMGLADEAVALAERCGPALELRARVLRVELLHAADLRDLHRAEPDLRRALSVAREASSIWQEMHIEGDLAVLEAELGRVDAAVERLRRLAARAEERGMQGQLRTLLHNLSTCLMREDRADEAAATAQRAADLALAAGDPTLRGTALSLQAYALLCTGNLDAALAGAGEAEWLQRGRDDRMLAQTLLRRAAILDAMERPDEALSAARSAKQTADLHGQRGFGLTAVLQEKLFLGRLGQAGAEDVLAALDAVETSGVGQRALARRLCEQAAAWLAGGTARMTGLPPTPPSTYPERSNG